MNATERNPLGRVDCTETCPLDEACYGCHRGESLSPAAVLTPSGVYCLTICEDCVMGAGLPSLDEDEAAELVLAHCEHLGITAAEMVEALAEARR